MATLNDLAEAVISFKEEEAKKLVESEGGEASSSVSSGTDLVVSGANPGSKVEEARKKGIKIITEEEFKKLI